jgi:PST family polysaccharide transporter
MSAPWARDVRAALSNLLFTFVSIPIEKVSRLLLVFVSAPLLGEAAFGRFQYATMVTAALALGTDLGLGLWTTRELARSQARAPEIVGTGLRVRLWATLPYTAATLVVAALLSSSEARVLLLVLGLSAPVNALIDHFGAILRGYGQFRDQARLNAARASLVVTCGLGSLWLTPSVTALAAGVSVATLLAGAYGLWIIHRRHRFPTAFDRNAFDPALARIATRESLPIWLAGLLSMLYFKGDVILLRAFLGDAELGAYSAAYKIFEGSMLLPAVLLTAVFPSLARADGERQRRWETLVTSVLLGLGVLVGATCFVMSSQIIAVVFGHGFVRAVPSLRILSLGLPLLYVNFGLTHFLIARDLGSKNLLLAASMLVLNVGLNLVAIPRWGGPGAAWATLLTEAALLVSCLTILGSKPGLRSAVPALSLQATARRD